MAGRNTGGQVIKKGENKWLIRWYEGQEAGKNRYKSTLVRGTKKDAQATLARILHEKSTGTYVEPSRESLDSYLDRWLEAAARLKLRPGVYRDYEDKLRLYIRPELGSKPLAKLTALDIQAAYARLLERGLSARTVRYAHSVLSSALTQAVKWNVLARNPAAGVELPAQQRREMRALTPQEVRRFLAEAEQDRYGPLFLLAMTTGLRPSEYLALKWADIDLKSATLSVQRSMGRDKEFQDTKRPRSRRTVHLQPTVVEALIRHRDRQVFERKAAGDRWQDHGLVFTTHTGAPVMERNLVQRHFEPVVRRAGLGHLRLYDLRHTAATLALAAGVPAKVVSEQLGHASTAFTMDCYAHVLPNMQEDAAARVEALLFGPAHAEQRAGVRA